MNPFDTLEITKELLLLQQKEISKLRKENEALKSTITKLKRKKSFWLRFWKVGVFLFLVFFGELGLRMLGKKKIVYLKKVKQEMSSLQ